MTWQRLATRIALTAVILATPFPAAAATPPDQPRRAVILVPGYGARLTSPTGLPIQTALRERGYDVCIGVDGDMTGAFLPAANALIAQGRGLRTAGYDTVDLVGYSAGGLAARTAITVDHARGARTFRTAVAVGSALSGTDLEALGPGWECDGHAACEQWRPTSAFLASLPPLPTGRGAARLVSLWTQDDLVNVPVTTSVLPGALNVRIQAACPGIVGIWTGHEHLAASPAFTDLTVQALTGDIDPAASVYRCALPTG